MNNNTLNSVTTEHSRFWYVNSDLGLQAIHDSYVTRKFVTVVNAMDLIPRQINPADSQVNFVNLFPF